MSDFKDYINYSINREYPPVKQDIETDGGAFVGTRLNVPKGLTTPEAQAKQSTLIADTLAGAAKGVTQGFIGLPGDLEAIGRGVKEIFKRGGDESMIDAFMSGIQQKTILPTSDTVSKWLDENVGPVVPKENTLSSLVAGPSDMQKERERAAKGGELTGEILAPGGQIKAAKGVVKAAGKVLDKLPKDLPVGMSIKMIDGTEMVLDKAPKIETKAFKNWFGESKAVDDSGKPIVVYHATRGNFDEFNTTGEGQSINTGAFFSSSPDVAATYNTSSEHSMVPAYLSLKNPMIVDANGANWNRIGQDAKVSLPEIKVSAKDNEMLLSELTGDAPNLNATMSIPAKNATAGEIFGEQVFEKGFSTNEMARWARSKGYDGVIFKNVVDHGPAVRFSTEASEKPSNIYVAFEPTQIKSAISNKGTFDPKDPNILRGGAGVGTGAAATQNQESK